MGWKSRVFYYSTSVLFIPLFERGLSPRSNRGKRQTCIIPAGRRGNACFSWKAACYTTKTATSFPRQGLNDRPAGRTYSEAGMDFSDEEILVRASAGDRDAFGMLYERYVERIFNYVYYRTGNVNDAEDLTARVFQR